MRLPVPWVTSIVLLFSVVALASVVGCEPARVLGQTEVASPSLVPVAGKPAWDGRYAEQIQPIFDRYCVSCHGQTGTGGGLKLTSYEGVMKGTPYGAVVIPGSSSGSALISVLAGAADPNTSTPHRARGPDGVELRNITRWIEAGACPD